MDRRPHKPTDITATSELVFAEWPRCPVCESTDLKTIRSADQGDGSVKRRTACGNCGHRFFIVWE